MYFTLFFFFRWEFYFILFFFLDENFTLFLNLDSKQSLMIQSNGSRLAILISFLPNLPLWLWDKKKKKKKNVIFFFLSSLPENL